MTKKRSVIRTVIPEGYNPKDINTWYQYISQQVFKLTGKTTTK